MDVRKKLVELLDIIIQPGQKTLGDIADHLIDHDVTVQEWISVDDRLPNDNDRVIAFRPNEPETSAYKYCVMWGWSVKASLKHRGITHWCAMPQPPKGETIYCKGCEHLMFSDCYGECAKGYKGIVQPNDTCEHARRKPPKGE